MSQGDIHNEGQARAILRLAVDAPASAFRAAFQREVKAAHPDRGGDAEQLRLVVEAYRFLKAAGGEPPRPARSRAAPQPAPQAQAAPEPQPDIEPRPDAPFSISIVEAFQGCEKSLRTAASRRFKVRLPAGLQTGDVVRFGNEGEHYLTIAVAAHEGAELRGADLWLTVRVSPEFMREGGRMEVDTPLGGRQFWVSRTSAARGVFRAPGEGLPERTGRARGHLYLAFELDESLSQSASRSLLKRFAAAWVGA